MRPHMRPHGSGLNPTPECTDESSPASLRCLELSHRPPLQDEVSVLVEDQ